MFYFIFLYKIPLITLKPTNRSILEYPPAHLLVLLLSLLEALASPAVHPAGLSLGAAAAAVLEAARAALQDGAARLLLERQGEPVSHVLPEPRVRHARAPRLAHHHALPARLHVVLHAEIRRAPVHQHALVARHRRELEVTFTGNKQIWWVIQRLVAKSYLYTYFLSLAKVTSSCSIFNNMTRSFAFLLSVSIINC